MVLERSYRAYRSDRLAGVPGLEPRLTEPESVVLPITPYPKGVSRPLVENHRPVVTRPPILAVGGALPQIGCRQPQPAEQLAQLVQHGDAGRGWRRHCRPRTAVVDPAVQPHRLQ